MKKVCFLMAALLFAGVAGAATTYTVGPADLSAGIGFGWDPDMDAPVGVSTEGTLNGNSFWSNVSGVAPTKYTAFRFVPQAIGFSAGVTMNDITSFTYDTKLVEVSDTVKYDWRVSLYTVVQDGQTDGWYGSRISYGYNATPHDWATTDVLAEGAYRVEFGAGGNYYDYTTGFDDALATALSQEIYFIDIIAGANSPHPAVDAYLDNIQMAGAGVDAQVDLIPEPATLALLGLGGLLLRHKK